MEFLEKLYSQEYFAPILFGVIIVLIITFIIVFILALRDAKKNQENVESTESFVDLPKENESVAGADTPLVNEEVELTPEVKEETTVVTEDPVVSNLEPETNTFEEVQIDIPEAIAPISDEDEEEKPLDTAGNETIKVEESPVASSEEVAKAENELDQIAATLLAEYQKEPAASEVTESPVAPAPVESNEQFSSVFVTPNTLPAEEEKKADIPDIADIPLPQPVRVVSQSTIIDSSNQENPVDINNMEAEEYNIKR